MPLAPLATGPQSKESIVSTNHSRKALISLTSFNGAIFPDGSKTGAFFIEVLHPFQVLSEAGFEVDFASESGTYGWDQFSLTPPMLAGSDKAVAENANHPFMLKMKSEVKKAIDLRAGEYSLFFAAAGHGALYDYPNARALQAAASDVWNRGGILAAVCHAPVLLPGVLDAKTGVSVINGKTVTGFADEGEMILGVAERLKADGVLTVEPSVTNAGAVYSSPMQAFDDYSVSCGRLITGVGPASARSTAERAVRAFATI